MMKSLNMDRRLLYNEDLTLSEVVLLAIVQEAGEDGFMYGIKYLSRAMNVTAARVEVIKNILVKHAYLIDTASCALPGVMRLSVLHLGPKTIALLESRKIGSGDMNTEYIPAYNLEEVIEDIKGI